MAHQSSDQTTIGLGSLIKNDRFEIPKHQRDFQWDYDRIKEFFEDVGGALERDEDLYFVGLMVLQSQADGKFIVLDGQQRITTSLLFFSAIRNWLKQCSSGDIRDEAVKVEDWFLGTSELGQKVPLPKLELNAANNPDFLQYVIATGDHDDAITKELKGLGAKHRRRRLLEGILHSTRLVNGKAETFESEEDAATYFYQLITYIQEKVRVVNLVVPSDGAAYSIFETLNDRGMSLAPLDLIKNYVFSKIDGNKLYNLDHVQDRWTEMLALLQNVDPNKFIGVFWKANHDNIQNPKVFSAFKEKYKEASRANEVSKKLRKAAEFYAGLEVPEDAIWLGHTPKAKELIQTLKTIGATQVHPVLLAMLQANFGATEMEASLRSLETVLVRYQLIGSGRPGVLEKLGAELLRRLQLVKSKAPLILEISTKQYCLLIQTLRLPFLGTQKKPPRSAGIC